MRTMYVISPCEVVDGVSPARSNIKIIRLDLAKYTLVREMISCTEQTIKNKVLQFYM